MPGLTKSNDKHPSFKTATHEFGQVTDGVSSSLCIRSVSRSVSSPPWIFPFGQRHGRLAAGVTCSPGYRQRDIRLARTIDIGRQAELARHTQRETRWRTGDERTCRVMGCVSTCVVYGTVTI